ncbi:hypothetical protein DICVIV_04365 [Dictyocaulus viviparus]|uniref:Uncharacterized protein n=1 Tax=Dictyocaulus viviparus TaxID=29172 RepID=A0A0D8Y4J4_DICVI|nr:hypothetical protein DICVIV_04365 [Dictyocaulus viviparus]
MESTEKRQVYFGERFCSTPNVHAPSTGPNHSLIFFIVSMSGAVDHQFSILQHSPIGLRLSRLDEELGADLREHGLSGVNLMTYTIEKKLNAQTLSSVLMLIVRWRTKAKLRASKRRRLADMRTKTEATENHVEMTNLNNMSGNSLVHP